MMAWVRVLTFTFFWGMLLFVFYSFFLHLYNHLVLRDFRVASDFYSLQLPPLRHLRKPVVHNKWSLLDVPLLKNRQYWYNSLKEGHLLPWHRPAGVHVGGRQQRRVQARVEMLVFCELKMMRRFVFSLFSRKLETKDHLSSRRCVESLGSVTLDWWPLMWYS